MGSRGGNSSMTTAKPTTLARTRPDDVILEYGETKAFDPGRFPEAARQVVKNEINQGSDDRLAIEWLSDGRVKLHATSYVGVVSLPGGLTIEIRPKVEDAELLSLLQYSQGVQAETIEEETSLRKGNDFIRALATLFEAELDNVIQRGLIREYRRTDDTEDHVRGRIAVQRQLQRHGPQPTRFECSYDTLTQDTVLNQAILHATDLILQLIGDNHPGKALQRHKQVLQRAVELRPVSPAELNAVELSRLASHYEDLYRLTRLVLSGIYTDELRAGSRSSFSLLVNMNKIFEGIVERALDAVFEESAVSVESQEHEQNLLWGGSREIGIKPDILVVEGGATVFVGDAKWKQDSEDSREPSNNDLYQALAYQVAFDVPGILFYPAQDNRVAGTFHSPLDNDLHVVELPTQARTESTYAETVQEELCPIRDLVGVT